MIIWSGTALGSGMTQRKWQKPNAGGIIVVWKNFISLYYLSGVLEVLRPKSGESYLDLTAGYAGHASEILDVTQNYKGATLVDRDENAVKILREKFASLPVRIVNLDFYNAVLQEIECGNAYDMILMDFGVSSPQLDRAERGFSFAKDGPLDMRMDQSQDLTAERVANKYRESELVEILEKYGEEKPGFAKLVARTIVHGRPWTSTKQLGEALAKFGRHGKVHPATRIFQAIRIAVNDELGEIERTLPLLPKVLKPGGRVAMITFHSLGSAGEGLPEGSFGARRGIRASDFDTETVGCGK